MREPAEEVRELMLERLDAALRAVWPRVLEADDGAINSLLRIEARRAKLLGLDAPATVSHDVLLRQIAAAAAEEAQLDPDQVVAEAEKILAKFDRDGGGKGPAC